MNHDAPPSHRLRLLSLDAFRGLTILAMILVNNPGSWAPGMRYAPLDHALWHGWTPTDLIFPFFLFIVGTSLAYSLRKYRDGSAIAPAVYGRIARRTALLVALGLGMGLFGQACDIWFGTASGFHLESLRWPGVLQRIALVYLAASLIVLHLGVRGQFVLAAVLLVGYWGLLRWHPSHDEYAANLSPEGNMVRVVDRAVLGESHMYTQAKTEKTDPEGLLSTLPAIVTALLGYWTGLVIQHSSTAATQRGDAVASASRQEAPPGWQTVATLAYCGAVVAAAGLLWNEAFPINKKLWTSSFVLLSGGLAMVALAACLALFDVAGWRRLGSAFQIVGVNAITVFVGSGLLARLLASAHIGPLSVKDWLYQRLFTDYIRSPQLASLGFALMTTAFWWLIAWLMACRGWSLRV
jgi:predicted acyltransferase